MKHSAALSALVLCLVGATAADPPTKALPLPGEVFALNGRTAFLIPATADPHAAAKPWVWYAPTLPNPEEAWMFERFRAAEASRSSAASGSCG